MLGLKFPPPLLLFGRIVTYEHGLKIIFKQKWLFLCYWNRKMLRKISISSSPVICIPILKKIRCYQMNINPVNVSMFAACFVFFLCSSRRVTGLGLRQFKAFLDHVFIFFLWKMTFTNAPTPLKYGFWSIDNFSLVKLIFVFTHGQKNVIGLGCISQ